MKVAWKTINGYGPYAYLQQSVWMGGGKVVSKHIEYLGKLGSGTLLPGGFVEHKGEDVLVPAVGPETLDELGSGTKKKALALLESKPAKAAKLAKPVKTPPPAQQDLDLVPASWASALKQNLATPVFDALVQEYAKQVQENPPTVKELLAFQDHPGVTKVKAPDRLTAATALVKQAKAKALKALVSKLLKQAAPAVKAQAKAAAKAADLPGPVPESGTAKAQGKDAGKAGALPDPVPDSWKELVPSHTFLGAPAGPYLQTIAAAHAGDAHALAGATANLGTALGGSKAAKAHAQQFATHVAAYMGLAPPGKEVASSGPAPPQASFVPKSSKGKDLVTPSNVKKLEKAAAAGIEELDAVAGALQAKLLSTSQKTAVENIAADLKAQITGTASVESVPESDHAQTIEDVAAGTAQLPKQHTPTAKTIRAQVEIAKSGDKNYDQDLELVSGKKGSNEGGLYKDKQLQTFHYVKWPSEVRARMEVLANHLYAITGVPVPHARLINFGKGYAVMSDWVHDASPMTVAQMKASKDVRDGFMVDAWLANWDVVGQDADNIVTVNGKALRIDPGGSLVFRAQGMPKAFPKEVAEVATMRNPGIAKQAGKVFGGMKAVEIKASAQRVADGTDTEIDETVDGAGIPHNDAGVAVHGAPSVKDLNAFLKAALKGRRDYIIENVLNAEVKDPAGTKELQEISGLKPEAAAHVAAVGGAPDALGGPLSKTDRHREVYATEIGKGGAGAHAAVKSVWNAWKGSTINAKSNVLRWAAGEIDDQGQLAERLMTKFWTFAQPNSPHTHLQEEFEKERASIGKKVVAGLPISHKANKGLLSLQFHNADPKKQTVTVWRSWRPDQVKFLKWKKPKIGDQVQLPKEPFIASYTLKPGGVFGVGAGGVATKADVPLDQVLLTDRFDGVGSLESEDEIVWCCPGDVSMEVTKVG